VESNWWGKQRMRVCEGEKVITGVSPKRERNNGNKRETSSSKPNSTKLEFVDVNQQERKRKD
jgi:hypothetical protein